MEHDRVAEGKRKRSLHRFSFHNSNLANFQYTTLMPPSSFRRVCVHPPLSFSDVLSLSLFGSFQKAAWKKGVRRERRERGEEKAERKSRTPIEILSKDTAKERSTQKEGKKKKGAPFARSVPPKGKVPGERERIFGRSRERERGLQNP